MNLHVAKSTHTEELRTAWLADADPLVASAGWALTSTAVPNCTSPFAPTWIAEMVSRQTAS